MADSESNNDQEILTKTVKKLPKRGIIYLSTIPPYMTVTKIREVFSEFGKVGRIYLQLSDAETKKDKKNKGKRKGSPKFTEGWIEFERKSTAKKVAQLLNNTQVNTRKKSKQYDCIWNIKYLSNFKWIHLHERLAYEKAARRQKLRAEIELAKKKTNYFTANLDKKKKNKSVVNKELNNLEKVEDAQMKTLQEDDTTTNKPREEFLKLLFT